MTSPTIARTHPRAVLWLSRMTVGAVAAAVVATTAPAIADDDAPPGRRIVEHTVRDGDTATGLAVKYHAWTAELISLNDLGSSAALRVGQRIRIPVVRSAAAKDKKKSTPATKTNKPAAEKPKAKKPRAKSNRRHADPSREKVRRVITSTARRHGVDPQLALAVSWQESGWQMHHVSSANAIGAMQVLPGTGDWMSLYAGRSLKLRNVHDNVLAGVLLLDLLGDQTRKSHHRIGAYYQGLGAVREHGLYDDTRAYVRNVKAIKRRLEATGHP